MAITIGELVASLGIDTIEIDMAEQAFRKFERSAQSTVDSINNKLRTTGSSMRRFGRDASLYMTAPLALVGGAAFKMQKDFESSMTKIISLVGVSRKQVDEWTGKILELGPALGKSPRELADAMFFITSAGLRGAEALDVLQSSAKASAAGLGETKVVADLVTSAINAYGVENLSAAKATDILVAAVKEGKAEAPALAASLGQVLPIASEMGITFDQVGAAVAAMTRTGTEAATAAIQLRQIMNSLLNPTQQSEEALRKMGTSGLQLRSVIKEQGLLAALLEINTLTKQFGEDTVAKVFPNIRALSGVLDLMGKNVEENVKIFESLADSLGIAESAFKTASETVEFKWNKAIAEGQQALTKLGKVLTDTILPILENLVERLGSLVEWFDSLTESQKRMIVIIGGVVAALGPLSLTLGLLVGSVLPGLITIGTKVVTMFKALQAVMLANPALAVATGIGILAVALGSFITKGIQASEAQKKLNDELERTKQFEEQLGSIERLIGVVESLNQRQLLDLKRRIEDQVNLEQDAVAKRLAAEQEAINKMNAAREKSDKVLDEMLKGQLELVSDVTSRQVKIIEQGQDSIIEKEMTTNKERLSIYEQYLKDVNEKLKQFEPTKNKDGGGIIIPPGITDALDKLSQQEQHITQINNLLGDSYDEVSAKVSLYRSVLDELVTIIEELDPASAGIDVANEAILNLVKNIKELENTSDLMINFRKELSTIEQLGQLLGNSYNTVAKQLQLFNTVLEQGVRSGELSEEQIKTITERINELRIANKSLQDELEQTAQKQQVFAQLGNAAATMAEQMGAALVSSENIMISLAVTVLRSAQQIVHALLAQAVAAMIAKEAVKGLPGLITAAIGVSALLVLAESALKKAKTPKLAEGGRIPPGFPNDTYPALLSSGETVYPSPEKLQFDRLEPQRVIVDVTVKGIQKGEDIHYVLEEVRRRYENNF